jgi:hypothetical protein
VETEKSKMGGHHGHVVFGNKNPWWKRKCEMMRFRDETVSCFVAKFRGEVSVQFHVVAIKYHSSKRNWLCGLLGRIVCERSHWCQRKWWPCSWLCSSPVSPLFVSASLHSVYASCFIRRTFFQSLPHFPSHFFRVMH